MNKQGSVASLSCNKVARRIWTFALAHDLWVSATYIPGVNNVEADAGSRVFRDETEWTLDIECYQILCRELAFTPSWDLFASRLNCKEQFYCSWRPDPSCTHHDAFSISWSGKPFWAFPPFPLIARVLTKIVEDKATGIVMVPYWPTKPWFSKLCRLIIGTPVTFLLESNTLFLPGRNQEQHGLVGTTTMVAATCCGAQSSATGSPTWRRSGCPTAGGRRRAPTTLTRSGSGLPFATPGGGTHSTALSLKGSSS